jgi:hypothetical protein
MALRVSLALVNREANDDHMTPIRMIRTTGQLPTKTDCWECFQPKLFHRTAAAVLDIGHVPPGIAEIKIVQLMNAMLGSPILVFAWRFIRELNVGVHAKGFAFALLALNPTLIGVNGQATNDTFVIFFGVATLYWAYRFGRVGACDGSSS